MKENYRKINFSPYLWGKHGWIFLNHVALSYPTNPTQEEKNIYKNFFSNIHYILPCDSCSLNYVKHYNELPIDNYLDNNDKLFSWVIKMQNKVNKLLNKPLLDEKKIKHIHMNPSKPMSYKLKIILYIISIFSIIYIINTVLNIKKINIIYN